MDGPRVSVVLPVWNAADFIEDAVASALGQTFEDLELVVVDNASTDDTVELVRSFDDPRLRLLRNRENIGSHRNTNRAIVASRGELVKFLHADDRLYPTCVERLAETFERSDRIGMAFSRRHIAIDENDPDSVSFRATFSATHRRFEGLQEVNDGHALLRQWIAQHFEVNNVGEPSNVMVRRAALYDSGLLSVRMQRYNDIDLWARVMARWDVAFVDEVLSEYRFHAESLTLSQAAWSVWLERLWILETLRSDPEVRAALPEIVPAVRAEQRRITRFVVRLLQRDRQLAAYGLRQLSDYTAYRLRRLLGTAEPLFPKLERAQPLT